MCVLFPGQRLDSGYGTASASGDDGHLEAVFAVAVESGIDNTWFKYAAPKQRQISPLDGARLELCCEVAMGVVVLGHHQQTGGFTVEAVNDPWSQHTVDPGQIMAVME